MSYIDKCVLCNGRMIRDGDTIKCDQCNYAIVSRPVKPIKQLVTA